MGRNWLRLCSVTVGGDSGQSLDLGNLRIRFETISHTQQELGSANIIISNVSRQTYAQLQNEFTRITLKCGYQDGVQPGVIFSGTITETQYGEKEGWTDPLLRIWARDGDTGYNQAKVSQTLAAGSTPQDIVNTSLKALQPFGISMGQVIGIDLSQPKFPRGYVLAGMARDFLREVALSKQATWNVNRGRLNFVGKGADVPGEGIVLNSETGMIGQPIQTMQGIMVRCLINPAIDVDTNVQISQGSIVQTTVTNDRLDTTGGDANLKQELSSQGVNDGVYRVLHVRTEGDTRGSPWWMDLTCIGSKTGVVSATQAGLGLS